MTYGYSWWSAIDPIAKKVEGYAESTRKDNISHVAKELRIARCTSQNPMITKLRAQVDTFDAVEGEANT